MKKDYRCERIEVLNQTPEHGLVRWIGISLPGDDTGMDWELRTEGGALISKGHSIDQMTAMSEMYTAMDAYTDQDPSSVKNRVECSFCGKEYPAHSEDAEVQRAFCKKYGGGLFRNHAGHRICPACVRGVNDMNTVGSTLAQGVDTASSIGMRVTRIAGIAAIMERKGLENLDQEIFFEEAKGLIEIALMLHDQAETYIARRLEAERLEAESRKVEEE